MGTASSAAPEVTVALAVYNNAPYVGEAIDSILGQTFTDFEFLIVNDGSTDGSAEVIDARAASDRRIRVIHQSNRGLIASLNLLFAEASAPWVARMDGDDISLPDRLGKQLAHVKADPRLGVISCNSILIGPDGKQLPGKAAPKPATHDEVYANLEDGALISHPAAMVRRDPMLELGGYRAAYRHAEDHDLWLRMVDVVHFGNLQEELSAYRVYPEQVSNRHLVEQASNAAIAWQARLERLAGRPDPTEGLDQLPPLSEIDALFGRKGVADYVRRKVVSRMLYTPEALAGDGYALALDYIASTGADPQLWRASARLLRAGKPRQAAGMAHALLKAG